MNGEVLVLQRVLLVHFFLGSHSPLWAWEDLLPLTWPFSLFPFLFMYSEWFRGRENKGYFRPFLVSFPNSRATSVLKKLLSWNIGARHWDLYVTGPMYEVHVFSNLHLISSYLLNRYCTLENLQWWWGGTKGWMSEGRLRPYQGAQLLMKKMVRLWQSID
jgi:hypothetical protein